jgi:hypothetical protein
MGFEAFELFFHIYDCSRFMTLSGVVQDVRLRWSDKDCSDRFAVLKVSLLHIIVLPFIYRWILTNISLLLIIDMITGVQL